VSHASAGGVALSQEEKRRQLLQKLQARQPVDDVFPLSYAQQRLWVVHRMDPLSTAYNLPNALRMRGALEVEVLGRALEMLALRHESLRTVFPAEGGVPVQRILPAGPVPLRLVDLRSLPPAEREAELARLVGDETSQPFDLAAGPLMRVAALRLAEEETMVVFTLHHIVTDGWSQNVLVRDLSEIYTALAEGRPPAPPPLLTRYADYAVWQRGWLSGGVLDAQLAFWRERLAGAPPLLELHTDRPRTSNPGSHAGHASFVLSARTSDALRALSRREGASLFMTLLAVYQALLSRWSGQEDVVVGTPVAGRPRVELENLIGFFANMLPLRTDLSGDPSGRELIRRVRTGVLEALAHEHLPFEKLVDELQVERSATHSPLFQAVFMLDAPGRETLRMKGVAAESSAWGDERAKFDLTLMMAERDGRVAGSLLYRTGLFASATMERFVEQLRRMLEQVAEDPDRRLSDVELLDGDERRRIVEEWNRTERPYPRDAGIHTLFERWAAERPDAVALVCGDERLAYAELNARANRLARHLRRRGVGPEARVGLFLERGVELVVAILGVLKAGGAYVPLDPAYPAERLAFMLADSAVALLLTQTSLHAAHPVAAGVPVVSVDGAAGEIGAESAANLESGGGARSLAYVMYTSGTTGTPRGVGIEHRGVVRLVREASYVDLGPGETILHAAPPSFDASTLELWGALLNGARLVLVPSALPSLEELGRTIREGCVTTLWLTAGLFRVMVRERLEDLAGVRQLLAGGDVLPVEEVKKVRGRFPSLRLINGYGPTENTTFTCCFTVPDGWSGGSVPIGVPVGNTRVYVLDGAMRLVPAGVPGELYAGGDGVARGYLGRPGPTAERFVPHPFAAEPGARLYRTGDRVRWLADGTLEYLGRLDAQVKIRGFRVEPGEIDSVLSALPGVQEARVVVREDEPGEKRLVAYVAGEVEGEALRAGLRRTLPEYMVPAAVVLLERLPLTPRGKLDAKALPAPEPARHADVAPRTPVEETLAAVWAEVLNVERVGVHDHFFELGGQSLLIMRLTAEVQARFGVELSVRAVFARPTLEGMAAEVDRLLYEDVLAMPDGEAEQEPQPAAGNRVSHSLLSADEEAGR
jgi:amino acid adenylation domain-containing protein